MPNILTDPVAIVPLIGTALIAMTILLAATRATATIGLAGPARDRLLRITSASLGIWIAIAAIAGLLGLFSGQILSVVPPVAFGLLLPMVAVPAMFAMSPTARQVLDAVPVRWIVGVQLYRVLGGVFLVLLAQGRMPAAFALPAGWGDIGVGIAALILAMTYRPGSRRWRAAAIGWNVLGILDLVVAVSTGAMSAPGPLQRFGFETPNTLITTFPFVLIPTVLVPLSILLHVAALRRLTLERDASMSRNEPELLATDSRDDTDPAVLNIKHLDRRARTID